ncbi:hypothetical protein CWO89_22495 [Bradyrhizobium sp. Leo170]|nr:hypothetical protein CWO89_22495 [Bradyrhizobium sp. Leo170]
MTAVVEATPGYPIQCAEDTNLRGEELAAAARSHGTMLLWANCFETGRSLCGEPKAVQIAAASASAVRM